MRAGRQDSLERRAGLLGYAPAGHVINGDKQLQPSQAQVFEAETCDESHRRGSDALGCGASRTCQAQSLANLLLKPDPGQ